MSYKRFKEQDFKIFWEEGIGRDFIKWTGAQPNLDKFKNYDQLFNLYDEEFDKIVSSAIADKSIGKILHELNKPHSEQKYSEDLSKLIQTMEEIPDWLDKDLLNKGAELSQKSGLSGLLVLRNFSLMGGYYFSNLTKPLVATGALEKGPTHRLYYTLQFWIDVSRTGNNAQDIRINSCLRTRLMHSISRLSILERYPNWDIEDLGVPINLADMIATNIGFSFYYLYGLKQMNYKYSEEEELGIFHLWKYVTWLLGVPEEFSPNNRKEAVEFFYYWTSKQNNPDNDSRKLAKALMKENTSVGLLKLNFLKKRMPYIHRSISNYLLDQQIKSALGIPKVKMGKVIPKVIQFKNRTIRNADKEKLMAKGDEEQRSVLEDYRKRSKQKKNAQ